MRAKTVIAITLIIAATSLLASPPACSAPVGIPILIDLTHRQPPSGIDIIIKVVPEAQWYILVKSEEEAEALSPVVKANVHGIIVGDFASIDLEKLGITMIIIGQPQAPFTPEEVSAIASWFTGGPGRAIWVAADSDYPAQGTELSQHAVNTILEAIGAHLRMDYVSVEDPVSNAGKGYRVLGLVNMSEVAVLRYGCERVLFHGPGAVAWVDEAGNWHKVTPQDKPDNVYILATTTVNGEILEHQAEPTGTSGKAYTPGETGVFTLMAAEVITVEGGKNVVIVSGETPYGGYQPMVTWKYHGRLLSGPRFVRNVILWATGYMGELREYEKLAVLPEEVSRTLAEKTQEITDKVNSAIAGVSSTLNAALGLSVLALILALVALALSLRKPKAA